MFQRHLGFGIHRSSLFKRSLLLQGVWFLRVSSLVLWTSTVFAMRSAQLAPLQVQFSNYAYPLEKANAAAIISIRNISAMNQNVKVVFEKEAITMTLINHLPSMMDVLNSPTAERRVFPPQNVPAVSVGIGGCSGGLSGEWCTLAPNSSVTMTVVTRCFPLAAGTTTCTWTMADSGSGAEPQCGPPNKSIGGWFRYYFQPTIMIQEDRGAVSATVMSYLYTTVASACGTPGLPEGPATTVLFNGGRPF